MGLIVCLDSMALLLHYAHREAWEKKSHYDALSPFPGELYRHEAKGARIFTSLSVYISAKNCVGASSLKHPQFRHLCMLYLFNQHMYHMVLKYITGSQCDVCVSIAFVGTLYIMLYFIHSTAFCDDGAIRLSIDDRIPQSYELIYDEPAIGRVEVCDGTSYGTLCSDSWDNEAASVVCSEFGFSVFGGL